MGDPARGDEGRGRAPRPDTCPRRSPPTTACGPSNRARATASSSRSPVPPTQWPARWTCSGRRWHRSSCASACTPATCTCATKATTSARRSTAPRGCATSRTAARPCLSGATEPLVVDQLPADVTLNDLGSHPLRDLPRPERVVQLCHPDLHNDFPPLRTANRRCSRNVFRRSCRVSSGAKRK